MKTKILALVALLFLSNSAQSSSGIDISDLDEAQVLCALYNNAKVQGSDFLHASSEDMRSDQAVSILVKTKSFDYISGRVMKVSFSDGVLLNAWLYDRDNARSVQSIIDELRAEKATTE